MFKPQLVLILFVAVNEHDWSPWNLLSNACDPHRTCRAALKKQDAEVIMFYIF